MARPRTSKLRFATFFEDADAPVYLLDDQRRILFVNSAASEWFGVSNEALVGLECRYAFPGDESPAQRLADIMCPPPATFAGKPRTMLISVQQGDKTVARHAQAIPVGTDLDCAGVFVVVDSEDSPEAGDNSFHQISTPCLHDQLRDLRLNLRDCYGMDRLIGSAHAMGRVREQVCLAADGHANILVIGPPGSGREHVARTVFYANKTQKQDMPLLPLSGVSAQPELLRDTLESFVRHCVQHNQSESTTVLLLGADLLDGVAQQVMLHALDHVGRVLGTSERSLITLANNGSYNIELAHRLSTLIVELPSLQERPEDIPLLAQLFLEESNRRGQRQVGGFTEEALNELALYSWPRNIDELAQIVNQAYDRTQDLLISAQDLPDRLRLAKDAAAHPPSVEEDLELETLLGRFERQIIWRALSRANGNKTKAAKILGISRARLLRRISQLELLD